MVFLSKGYPLSPSVELNWMASESECFTGSDLVVWLREAAYIAQRQETRPVIVEQKHLQEAIDRCLKMDQFEAEEEEEISGHWRPGMLPETLAQFASFGNRRK